MFNHVTVSFPNSTAAPQYVYKLYLHQNRYKHEIAVIQFRDWNVPYDAVETGSPITFAISDGINKKEFNGYVHHVRPHQTPSQNITEVMAISPSYKMKSQHQRVFKDLSADAVIQQICADYRFNAFTMSHPRIYPQISQAGHSDWELLVRLAKQCGYSLRTENTEVYFQPVLYEYTMKREGAPSFVMRSADKPQGSTLYSFTPVISEYVDYDGDAKAAIAVSGIDKQSNEVMSLTKQLRPKKTKIKSKPEFFDRFATNVVADDPTIAQYESDAAEQRASFPYRAKAKVIGNTDLRPDMPVFLDGIGDYSGYWVVLGAEHSIEEEQRGMFLYTTTLTLGTDSLGNATIWNDGKQVLSPDYMPKRTIVPGVRQTNTPPAATLLRTAANIGPQSNGVFSTVTNRSIPSINNRSISSASWVAKTKIVNPITQTVKKTQAYPNRLLTKTKGIL